MKSNPNDGLNLLYNSNDPVPSTSQLYYPPTDEATPANNDEIKYLAFTTDSNRASADGDNLVLLNDEDFEFPEEYRTESGEVVQLTRRVAIRLAEGNVIHVPENPGELLRMSSPPPQEGPNNNIIINPPGFESNDEVIRNAPPGALIVEAPSNLEPIQLQQLLNAAQIQVHERNVEGAEWNQV